eukprot:s3888_g4.t1
MPRIPAAPSQAKIRLRPLMKELRKFPEESLTPAIQAEMQKKRLPGREAGRQGPSDCCRRAVGRARRAVKSVVSSRAKRMSDWKVFLQQNVTTWREDEDQKAKRQRRDEEPPDEDAGEPLSPTLLAALQPCGKAGSGMSFHLDDPRVFGRIDWADYVHMMHEAPVLLRIEDDQLLGLIDIAVRLPDIPANVVPMIAHVGGDLDPDEPRSLALIDNEIHANSHEVHYFTAAVIDRAVYAVPNNADKRSVFQTADVELYCSNERHRCLLEHNRRSIVTLGNPRFLVAPGDHLKITIPPP